MNSALDFALPAKPSSIGGRTRRVIPSPRLFGSRVKVCSLPPPSSSLKVNISPSAEIYVSFMWKLNRITNLLLVLSMAIHSVLLSSHSNYMHLK